MEGGGGGHNGEIQKIGQGVSDIIFLLFWFLLYLFTLAWVKPRSLSVGCLVSFFPFLGGEM